MSDPNGIQRRQYVKALASASTVGITGLAGCTNEGSSGNPNRSNGESDSGSTSTGSNGSSGKNLVMSSFKQGTGWYVMAGAISDKVTSHLPGDSTISVKPVGGGVGVIPLLRQQEVDFGVGSPVSSEWAAQSKLIFQDKEKFNDLRSLVGYLDTYWLPFAVNSDVPVNSFQELKKKQYPLKLAVAPAGSLGAVGVEQTLNAYGITFEDIENWGGSIKQMAFPDMPSAVKGGDVEGMSQVATPGHPTWQQLSNDVDVKFLGHGEEAKQYLTERGWFDMPDIPEGTFGASQDIPTIGWRTELVTTTDLSDDVARGIVEGIVEKRDEIANAYSAMTVFDPEKAGKQKYTAVPLHEGAKSYFKDEGFL